MTALVNSSGVLQASYKYNPYGGLISSSGALASANRMRFSSKPAVFSSGGSWGFYYYGYRFYDPVNQRWLNRDPLRERGGVNLHRYVENSPPNFVDPLGLLKYSYSGGMLFVYPPWWKPWKTEPEVYWGTPELCQRILRDKGIEDAAVNAAVALAVLELKMRVLEEQWERQTPPPNCPKPPGWNEKWEWRAPTGEKDGNWRWFDPNGGEWRRHDQDKWHPNPHWDYNPWDNWNSDWQNIDDKGGPIPKLPAPTPPQDN